MTNFSFKLQITQKNIPLKERKLNEEKNDKVFQKNSQMTTQLF